MSIDIKFHFKSPDLFVDSIRNVLGINLSKSNDLESLLGEYLGFSLSLFKIEDQLDYFEDNKTFNKIKNIVKEYDTIFMLSSSAGQSHLRLIQESTLFNISYAICYIYKISGSITYDDGGYAGTISYKDNRIVNLDNNTIILVPQLEDIL